MSDNFDFLQEDFSERELEILQLIAAGHSNREIANELYLSVNTVRWYNKQIYSKLDVHSRTLAVARARELGILHGVEDISVDDDEDDELVSVTLTNLPTHLTPFIGRNKEIVEVTELLQEPNTRLVNIIGPGGMGKTRLSQEVAHRQIEHYDDGVFLVALAPLRADNVSAYDVILNAVLSNLHINAGQNAESQLFTFLTRKNMLLVFDNFEHMVDGAEILAKILNAAPQVDIIVTSRETLGLYGEAVYQLTGMAVPANAYVDGIMDYDAITLFVQSAERVKADFAPNEQDLEYAIRICRLVEGLPLGIELAAAWVRSLTLPEIVDEISQGLDILETRTSNIRMVFDRSWELITQTEQRVFAQMSVFRGGCTREAAQAVTGASLRMLTALVDKSLLWHLPDGYYAMHELLRQYAAEKLKSFADCDEVEMRHCNYYSAFAGRWGRALGEGQQIEAVNAIELEFDNIRAAWQCASQHGNEQAVQELIDMSYFFDIRARWREGYELFDQAAKIVTDTLVKGRLLAREAQLILRIAPLEKMEAVNDLAFNLLSQAGENGEIARCYLAFGNASMYRGNWNEVQKNWLQAAEIAAREGYRVIEAAAYGNLSIKEQQSGNFDKAKVYLHKQLEVAKEIGDYMNMAMALLNLGENARIEQDYEAAKIYYRSSLAAGQRIDQKFVIAGTIGQLGVIARLQKNRDEAKRLLEQSMMINREHGNLGLIVRNLVNLAEVAFDDHEFDTARYFYHEALGIILDITSIQLGIFALMSIAEFMTVQGHLLRAVELYSLVESLDSSRHDEKRRAVQFKGELQAHLAQDEFEAAVRRGQEIQYDTMVTALMIEYQTD